VGSGGRLRRILTEAIRSRSSFEKNGRYKASNYAEVSRNVIIPRLIARRYLPGQFLSHFIWPHHARCSEAMSSGPAGAGERFKLSRGGVGCGMYPLRPWRPAGKRCRLRYQPVRSRFHQAGADVHDVGQRYRIENRRHHRIPPETRADFIISQEVLEHLEIPRVHSGRYATWFVRAARLYHRGINAGLPTISISIGRPMKFRRQI